MTVLKETDNDQKQLNLEVLFNEYYRDMLAVAFKYLHRLEDAEDAVSRAFISLAANPGILKGLAPDQIKPRLMALTRFRAFDHYRGEEIHIHVELSGAEHKASQPDDIEASELSILVQQMKEPEKTFFSLRYVHDLNVSEIAELFGISSATVRKHLRKGKAWLRSALSGEDEDV